MEGKANTIITKSKPQKVIPGCLGDYIYIKQLYFIYISNVADKCLFVQSVFFQVLQRDLGNRSEFKVKL